MKLQVPFVQLPVVFDAAELAREVAAVDERHWRARAVGVSGNSALTLVTTEGDPDSDDLAGRMRPTPWLQQCPRIMQVMDALGATWGRARLMKLYGQSEVSAHVDTNYYWRERMRVHLPITTTPDVRFQCGDAEVNMGEGEVWIFDTWRRHRVLNGNNRERIHLVMDTVGGDGLWQLIRAGRTPGRPASGWSPRHVPFDLSRPTPSLDFESVNVPVVMSPWEMREHFVFLLGEAFQDDRLPAIQQALLDFARGWHALWSAFGEDRAGWPRYRALLDGIVPQLLRLGIGEIGLRNEVGLLFALKSYVFDVALADRDTRGEASRQDVHGNPAVAEAARAPVRRATAPPPAFDRPVFIISPPRSGSTLLFETLSGAPGVHTIGDESHRMIEGVPGLAPSQRDHESNRLSAADATLDVADLLRARFLAALRDREGRPPADGPVRLLEKTPKNALRIPFLRAVFPGARFLYLHRDLRQVLGSMIDGWQSGRFVMYPNLPGWQGLPWSFLLTPGWRALSGQPLEEIVARQWEASTRILLDDLEPLHAADWIGVDYQRFLANPADEVRRICEWAGWEWDRELSGRLPLSRYTLSTPDPEKWRRHAAGIEPRLAGLASLAGRAARAAEH